MFINIVSTSLKKLGCAFVNASNTCFVGSSICKLYLLKLVTECVIFVSNCMSDGVTLSLLRMPTGSCIDNGTTTGSITGSIT